MVFGVFRTAVMAIRMDTTGYVADMMRASVSTKAFDATVAGAGNRLAILQAQAAVVAATSVFAASRMVSSFADFEHQATIASIAAGHGADKTLEMSRAAMHLSRTLSESPQTMAELTKSVRFFGLQSDAAISKVAEMSTRLSQLGEVSAEDTAQIVIRLLNITRRTGETLDDAAMRVDSLAGSIFTVGTSITAGIGDLIKFIQQFQVAGVTANFTAEQIIAVGGAVADLVPQMRAITTTAVIRAFTTEEFRLLGKHLGISADEAKRLRKEDPVEFIMRLGQALKLAGEDDALISMMKDLGLGGIREAKGLLAFTANLEKLPHLLELTSDHGRNVNEFMKASEFLLADSRKRLDAFRRSIGRLSIAVGEILAPAFILLTDSLTNLLDLLARNKLLTTLLATGIAGGGFLASRLLMNLILKPTTGRTMGGLMAMAGGALMHPGRVIGAIGARMGAARTAASGAIGGAAASVGSKGLMTMIVAALWGRIMKMLTSVVGGVGALLGRGGMSFGGLTFGAGAAGATAVPSIISTLSSVMGVLAGGLVRIIIPFATLATLSQLLTNPLSRLGDMLRNLGDQTGGPLGFLLNTLSVAARAFEFVGHSISLLWEALLFGLRKAWDFLESTWVGKGINMLGDFAGRVSDQIDAWNGSMKEGRDRLRESTEAQEEHNAAVSAGTEATRASTDANRVSIIFAGRQFAVEEFTNVMRSAFGHAPISVYPGGI